MMSRLIVQSMKKLVRNTRKYNGNSLLGLTARSCVGTVDLLQFAASKKDEAGYF